jgi:peptide/nickel transport system permease protein
MYCRHLHPRPTKPYQKLKERFDPPGVISTPPANHRHRDRTRDRQPTPVRGCRHAPEPTQAGDGTHVHDPPHLRGDGAVSRLAVAAAVGKRLGFAAIVLYLVVSLLFVAIAFSPNPPDSRAEAMAGSGPPEGSPRDASTPLVDRYTSFVGDYLTLNWGEKTTGATETTPYTTIVWNHLGVTAVMLLPAVVLTTVVGVTLGLYAGLNPHSPLERVARVTSYLGFAIPGFFLGIVIIYYGILHIGWEAPTYDPEWTLWSVYNFKRLILPSGVLAFGILGVQLRQVRTETLRHQSDEFVKLVRAKGGGFRTVGRHVLRVTVLPILSLFLSELLGLLLLSIIALEMVFGVPGYGRFLLSAAAGGEPQPVMAAAIVTVGLAIGSRLLEDLAYVVLEPRDDGGH